MKYIKFKKSNFVIVAMLLYVNSTMATSMLLRFGGKSSQIEEINVASSATLKLIEKNEMKKGRNVESDVANADGNKKGSITEIMSSLKNSVLGESKSLNPQEDLNELSNYYQALNYADVMAIEYLRKNCKEGGLLEPSFDSVLCTKYPSVLFKSVEARIGAVTSRFLFSNEALRAPPEWLEHALEILKVLEIYSKDYNAIESKSYNLDRALIQTIRDRAAGIEMIEEAINVPMASPITVMSLSGSGNIAEMKSAFNMLNVSNTFDANPLIPKNIVPVSQMNPPQEMQQQQHIQTPSMQEQSMMGVQQAPTPQSQIPAMQTQPMMQAQPMLQFQPMIQAQSTMQTQPTMQEPQVQTPVIQALPMISATQLPQMQQSMAQGQENQFGTSYFTQSPQPVNQISSLQTLPQQQQQQMFPAFKEQMIQNPYLMTTGNQMLPLPAQTPQVNLGSSPSFLSPTPLQTPQTCLQPLSSQFQLISPQVPMVIFPLSMLNRDKDGVSKEKEKSSSSGTISDETYDNNLSQSTSALTEGIISPIVSRSEPEPEPVARKFGTEWLFS